MSLVQQISVDCVVLDCASGLLLAWQYHVRELVCVKGWHHYLYLLSIYFCSRPFYDKRMSAEMAADFLGDEWKVRCNVFTCAHTYTEELYSLCSSTPPHPTPPHSQE